MTVSYSVLLIVLPLLFAFISLLNKKLASFLLIIVAIINIVLPILLPNGVFVIGDYSLVMGISLELNDFARVGLLLVNSLILIIALVTFSKYSKIQIVLLLATASLNGMLLTNDLFNVFVFLEITAIAGYLISSLNKKPYSSFQYLVLGTVGGSFFLLGTIILYSMFGTLNMTQLSTEIALVNPKSVLIPMLFIMIGIGVEAKFIGLNTWVKGVLGHSNVLTGPMIAGVYAATIGFVFGKLTGLFVIEDILFTVLASWLIVSVVLGDIMAFASTKSKEVLLYSSIAGASLAALLFVYGFYDWAVNLLIMNTAGKTALFIIINRLSEDVEDDQISSYKGIFKNHLYLGVVFTMITLSLMGLPLFVGYVIKVNYLVKISEQSILIAVILNLAALIEMIYYAKFLLKLWDKNGHDKTVKFNHVTKVVVGLIAALMLVFGIIQEPFIDHDEVFTPSMEVINNG